MTVRAVTRDLTPPEWYDSRDDVVELVRWLLDTSQITTISEVLYAFEKPWKWTVERDHMISLGREAA
jgi:hypothetical protein